MELDMEREVAEARGQALRQAVAKWVRGSDPKRVAAAVRWWCGEGPCPYVTGGVP